jgi:hypothetical protein
MSALRRNIIRHGKFASERPNHHGVRGQINRHIIIRGIRNCRTRKHGNLTVHHGQGGMYPVELHATKGWRYVVAWS